MDIVENPCMLYLGVIGDSLVDRDTGELAFKVGKKIAEANAVLVCGGLGGVMELACRGAKSKNGTTIGILPGYSKADANPYVDYPIATGLGEARNVVLVRTCDAIVAVSGGYGTLSELAFALKFGIPVVGLGTWDLRKSPKENAPFPSVDLPEEAVDIALQKSSEKRR